MDSIVCLGDREVLEKLAFAVHGLRSDACAWLVEVISCNLRDQRLEGFDEHTLHHRAILLVEPNLPVLHGHAPEPRIGQRAQCVSEAEAGLTIPFALHRQHRVRPGLDAASYSLGEVDAQEGQRRVRHGIDQAVDQALFFFF